MIPSESEDQLLADLIDLPLAEREAFLDRTCGNDLSKRQRLVGRLEELIASLSTGGGGTSQIPGGSSTSEIAHALSAGLDLLDKPGSLIGHYKLLEKIGEGGCGIVYLAGQLQPVKRQVALKLIKLGLDTREFIARFETERQSLALMEHPNIARVFDAGATEMGRPYFVMELVRGVAITRYCDEHRLPVRERLQLFVSVCQAVQHAHQKGVIHRDLKPSNILVALHDGVPLPKIIDFGIAKALGQGLTEDMRFTQFHSFIGTPAYTSPEQLEMSGLDVDTRSDIYSLGALLYELLTGRTPFDGQELARVGLDAMRKIIRETEPPRPSTCLSATKQGEIVEIALRRGIEPPKLIHLIRGDLDWITMKCIEKDRTRRYATANGLAADVTRYLHDEPVVARPPSAAYRLQKLVRRNRLVFTAGAAVALALLLGTVTSTWLAVQATRAKRDALASQASEATARARAEAQELSARQRAYASDLNLAMQALHGNNLGRAIELLERQRPPPAQSDLRGWEWRYLWQQTRSDALSTLCEKSEIESIAVSADGRWFAIGVVHAEGIFVWDLQNRREVAHLARGQDHVRTAFSPTGSLLAYSGEGGAHRLHLWDAATQQSVNELPLDSGCHGLVFSADGRTLVTATSSKITVWQVSDGVPRASYPCDVLDAGPPSTNFAVVADGSVAAYGSQQRIRVVDLRDGKERWNAVATQESISACAFSPDGKTLATSGIGDGDIRLWEVATGRETGRLLGHTSFVGSLVFWPDGKKLASCSGDQTIRVWDIVSRSCTDVLRGHREEVWRLALLPDNRTLISACKDGRVCLWDTALTHGRKESITWSEKISGWCFTSDSRSVLTVDSDGQVARWSGRDFDRKEWILETGNGRPGASLFSNDGRFLACASETGSIAVWDLAQRVVSHTFRPAREQVMPMTFLASGSRLLIWSRDEGRLIEWDLAANHESQSWPAPEALFYFSWGLSRDERLLATPGLRGDFSVRDLVKKSTTKPRVQILEAGGGVAFSPSGKLLAMSSWLGYARVWDTSTWNEVATLRGYLNGVFSVAFSPDGNRLATSASATGEALKLWAVDSWQDVLTLHAEGARFIDVTFSPDGNAVGVVSLIGQLHVWRAPSWEEIERAEASDRGSSRL